LLALAYAAAVAGILASSPAYAGQKGDAAGRTPWTLTGGLLHARESFQATTLLDGRVVAEGGDDGGTMLSSSVIFDPISKTWANSGNLNAARSLHSATLLADGSVLTAGGEGVSNTAIASAELYDPASGTWTKTGDMIEARQ